MEFLPQAIAKDLVTSGHWSVARKNKPHFSLLITNHWPLATLLVSSFWFLVFVAGCVTLPKADKEDPMPHGEVRQTVATWNHQVVFAADPVHGGVESPGLVGRLYLFGQEVSFPVIDDGSVIVDLYDDSQSEEKSAAEVANGSQQLPLEEWRFDPITLKKLAKKDMIGWGYTLFLPWGTYKPDIHQVHLKVRYLTAKGIPFFAESGPLSLQMTMAGSHHQVKVGGKSNSQTAPATSAPAISQAGMINDPPSGPPVPVR
jgi:hypothetical protein